MKCFLRRKSMSNHCSYCKHYFHVGMCRVIIKSRIPSERGLTALCCCEGGSKL